MQDPTAIKLPGLLRVFFFPSPAAFRAGVGKVAAELVAAGEQRSAVYSPGSRAGKWDEGSTIMN